VPDGADRGRQKKGRQARKQEQPLIGAVDIGGTKIEVGMIDKDGRVRARRECPTDLDHGYAKPLISNATVSFKKAEVQAAAAAVSGAN
jgi:predicted NBD/HSP70 family sugar kinase